MEFTGKKFEYQAHYKNGSVIIVEGETEQECLANIYDNVKMEGPIFSISLMKFLIDYNTGLEPEPFHGTLKQAEEYADKHAAYTMKPIEITDPDGWQMAVRDWQGLAYDPETDDMENPICFGQAGFFADWYEG